MAGTILYPQGPLIIVDKGMRKRQGQGSKSRVGCGDEKDIKISIFDGTKPRSPQRDSVRSERFSNQSTGKHNIRFIQTLDAKGKPIKRKQSRKSCTPSSKSSDTISEEKRSDRGTRASSRSTTTAHSDTLDVIAPPGSTLTFYARDHGIKAESLSILPFYFDTSKLYYPMQNVLPLAYDPISMVYLPEALTDECCLTAMLYTTSGRLEHKMSWRAIDGPALYQHSISTLRKRIAAGCVKDHTICAVSLLATYEYCKGESRDSNAHLNGIINLIKARGGLTGVDKRIHAKIYRYVAPMFASGQDVDTAPRALLTPAIDRLEKPYLPQMMRNYPSLTKSFGLSSRENSLQKVDLLQRDLHPIVLDGLLQLLRLVEAINHAITQDLKVDPFSLDEDISSIQHQLLALDETGCSDLDLACKLAALAFTKMLCREQPFESAHCIRIAAAMKQAYCSMSVKAQSDNFGLWILVIGALIAQHTDEGPWFSAEVEVSCLAKGISTLEHLGRSLNQVMWIPAVLDSYLRHGVLGCQLELAWSTTSTTGFRLDTPVSDDTGVYTCT